MNIDRSGVSSGRTNRVAILFGTLVLLTTLFGWLAPTSAAQDSDEQLVWFDEFTVDGPSGTGTIQIERTAGTDVFTVTYIDIRIPQDMSAWPQFGACTRADKNIWEGVGTFATRGGELGLVFDTSYWWEQDYQGDCAEYTLEKSTPAAYLDWVPITESGMNGFAAHTDGEWVLTGVPTPREEPRPFEDFVVGEVEGSITPSDPTSSEESTSDSDTSENAASPRDTSDQSETDAAPGDAEQSFGDDATPLDSEDVSEEEALNAALAGVVAAALAGALTWAEAAAATRDLLENARLKRETPGPSVEPSTGSPTGEDGAEPERPGWWPSEEVDDDQADVPQSSSPAVSDGAPPDRPGWLPPDEASGDQPDVPQDSARAMGEEAPPDRPGWWPPDEASGDQPDVPQDSAPTVGAGAPPDRPGWLPPDEPGVESGAAHSAQADSEPHSGAEFTPVDTEEGAAAQDHGVAGSVPVGDGSQVPANSTVVHPDGSEERTVIQPDGTKIVQTRDRFENLRTETTHPDGTVTVDDLDLDDGRGRTTTTHPDGTMTTTDYNAETSTTVTSSPELDGTSRTETVHEDIDGSTRTDRTTRTEHADGTVVEATESDNGSVSQKVTEPDGTVTQRTTRQDGSSTLRTEHPDGTTTEAVTTPDGLTTESLRDRDGVTTSRTTEPDGSVVEAVTRTDGTTSTTVTAPDGSTRSSDSTTKFELGGERVTRTTNSDGTSSITVRDPDGSTSTTTRHADGSTTTHTTSGHLEDTNTETVYEPDGTITSRSAHPDGTESTRTVEPDGTVLESSTGPNGNSDSITHPDGSTTTRTAEPDGTITTKTRPAPAGLPRDFSPSTSATGQAPASNPPGSPTDDPAATSNPFTSMLPGLEGEAPPDSAPFSDSSSGAIPDASNELGSAPPQSDATPETSESPDLDDEVVPDFEPQGSGGEISPHEVEDIYRRGLASGRSLHDLEKDVSGLSQARGGTGEVEDPFGLAMRETSSGQAPMTSGELDDYMDQRAEVDRLREIRDNQDNAWAKLQESRESLSQRDLNREIQTIANAVDVWDVSSKYQADLSEAAAWVRTHDNWRLGDTAYKSPTGETWHQAAITPEENERLLRAQTDVQQMLLNRQRNDIEAVLNIDRDATIELDDLQEHLLVQRTALNEMLDKAQTSVDTYESWATSGRPLPDR